MGVAWVPAVGVLSSAPLEAPRPFHTERSGESCLSLTSLKVCLSLSFILRKHLAEWGTLLSAAPQTLLPQRCCLLSHSAVKHSTSDNRAVHCSRAQVLRHGASRRPGGWHTAVQSLAARPPEQLPC